MANAIALNPSLGLSGATNSVKTFSLAGPTSGSDPSKIGTLRANYSATLGNSELLLIEHQAVKGSAVKAAVDRHSVRLNFTKAATGDYPEAVASVYLNGIIPRVQFSAAEITDMVGLLIDLINNSGYLTRILANDPIIEA